MAGYVTQKRDRSTTEVASVQLFSSPTVNEKVNVRIPDVQETYSYRSGIYGPSENESLVDDAKIFRSSRSYYGPYDTGHPFWTTRSRLEGINHLHGDFAIDGYGGDNPDRRVKGPLILSAAYRSVDELMPSISPTSQSYVDLMGTKAIASVRPLKPNAGLATMLGELKLDGLPSVTGASVFNRGLTPRSLASEYLNVEFGIKPLLSDIVKLRDVVLKSASIVKQLERDSGRIVRRQYSFPVETETSERTVEVPYYDALFGPIKSYTRVGSFQYQSLTDVTTRRVWFKGAFSYYLDPGKDLVGKFKRYEQLANQLRGTRLTAETVWELAPWSWLIDWFTDVQEVISNANALQDDDLVIKYGYLMVHTKTVRTVTSTGHFYGYPKPVSVSNTYVCERKERHRATPFGFGLDVDAFSPRRWAILSALGFLPDAGRSARA